MVSENIQKFTEVKGNVKMSDSSKENSEVEGIVKISESIQQNSKVQEKCIFGQAGVLQRKGFDCDVCSRTFSFRSNLQRHQKSVHSLVFNTKQSKKVTNSTIKRNAHFCEICEICEKSFAKSWLVIRHKRVVHKIDISSKISSLHQIDKKFKCHVCGRQFVAIHNLNKHLKVDHKIMPNYKKNLKCSRCSLSFPSRKSFLDHVSASHDVPLDVEKKHFNNVEEFNKWKGDIETGTSSKFIKGKSLNLVSGIQTINFICHRNGHYVNRSKGMRHAKYIGTNKIEFFCPANIFVKSEQPTNLFPANVIYYSIHLGHECDVRYIPLKKEGKDKLAGELASVVPVQHILCKIKESAGPTEGIAEEYAKEIIAEENDLKIYLHSNKINKQKIVDAKALKENKNNKEEAKCAILNLLDMIENINDKQCSEVVKSISAIINKINATGKHKRCILPIKNLFTINRNIMQQCSFPIRKSCKSTKNTV